jgi:D-lactate dehydrogenase
MRIAFFSTQSYDQESFESQLDNQAHEITYLKTSLNHHTAKLAEGCEAVCLFVNDTADAQVLQKLHELGVRYLALRCAGFNNVDLEKAKELDIKVVRVPAYSPHAVAEHTVALILTLNRKTHKAYNRVREGNFSLERLTGFDLHGKTVGVVGTGKIGQVFAGLMQGFGCRVIAYDPYPSEELQAKGVPYMGFKELLGQSDILSLHCPLTPETHHLIDAEAFASMKPRLMLINTSRGKLIDTRSAIEALRSGQLAYLGIDVYEMEEDLFFRDLSETIIDDEKILRLMSFPNVLITAHQAFFTHEALGEIAQTTLQNLDALAKGRASGNEL